MIPFNSLKWMDVWTRQNQLTGLIIHVVVFCCSVTDGGVTVLNFRMKKFKLI